MFYDEKEAQDVEEPITKENPIPPPVQPKDIELTARQFAMARGARQERCAGFYHWAAENFAARATRATWETRWNIFWDSPSR